MKKVMIVTSTRADFGLLRPVIKRVADSEKLQLCLVATGTHLLKEFGNTIEEIEKDFKVDFAPQIFKFGFGQKETAQSIAYTIEVFTELLSKEKPDMVVLLGDRYEIFAVATTAATLSIPIAHISGGDVTSGAKDDFYRHAITKMSNLHFPSCEDSKKRVIQLGETPDTVHNVGGLGNENINNIKLLELPQLEQSIDFKNLQPFFLVTYHPETQKNSSPTEDMQKLLDALDSTSENIVFTKSNADADGDALNDMIDKWCENHKDRAKAYFSLGLVRYLSAMKYASAVVGNSSSGVVETPAFKVPCVNIGNRQNGRYISQNVICTSAEKEDILKALKKCVSQQFKKECEMAQNPYDAHCITSEKIVEFIEQYLNTPHSTAKIFYDLK